MPAGVFKQWKLLYKLTFDPCVDLCSPLLTWRDLQHLVVVTARQANLEANDWTTNAVGRKGQSRTRRYINRIALITLHLITFGIFKRTPEDAIYKYMGNRTRNRVTYG